MGGTRASRWLRAVVGSRRVLALLGVAVLAAASVGIGAAVVRRAHAIVPDVCASGCAYKSINDAINALPSSGGTVTVGAGSYGAGFEAGATSVDNPITINKPVTLVGAGVGVSIINDAAAHPGTAMGPPVYSAGVVNITNPGGNVSISGFTLEGANVNDPNGDGILLLVEDTGTADTISISGNLFYSDSTIDPGLLFDQTDSIVVDFTSAAVNITNNTFRGVFRGALVEGSSNAINFTGNTLDNLHGQQDPVNPATLFVAEGLFFAADGGHDMPGAKVVSNNLFENYGGEGVAATAAYANQLGNLSNLTISSNTFNLSGILGDTPSNPTFESPDIYLRVEDVSPAPPATLTNVSIHDNTFTMASSAGAGDGIWLRSHVGTGITINHNVFHGSGSNAPLAGIAMTTDALGSPSATITNNLITGFAHGMLADTLSGGSVSASQNCIYANSTAGAAAGSGTTITATNNWWGAINGPLPGGSGNAATGNITSSPFLTTAAAICSPVTSLSLGAPNAVVGGVTEVSSSTPITLSSVVAPPTGSTIAHVFYRFYLQGSTPPAFTSVAGHTASFLLSGANGTYTVQDYAVDAAGSVEATHTTTLVLTTLVPGLDVAGSSGSGSAPNTGSPDTGYQAPASNGSTNTATGNAAHGTAGVTGQSGKAASKQAGMRGLPWWAYAGVGGLLLLALAGGVSFLRLRSRTRAQRA